MELLRTSAAGAEESLQELRGVHATTTFEQIKARFDRECGGFGTAPKFPRPVTLYFLFRFASGRGMETPGEILHRDSFAHPVKNDRRRRFR